MTYEEIKNNESITHCYVGFHQFYRSKDGYHRPISNIQSKHGDLVSRFEFGVVLTKQRAIELVKDSSIFNLFPTTIKEHNERIDLLIEELKLNKI